MYRGDRPCPGCGKPGTEEPRRYAGEVCLECKKALEIGYDLKENDENKYATIHFNPHSATKFEMTIGDSMMDCIHDYTAGPPYLSDSKHPDHNSGTLQAALRGFMETLDVGKRPNRIARITNRDSWSKTGITVPLSQGKMFFKFWKELCAYIIEVEKQAYLEGKDLLKGLNTGRHTLEDFEEEIENVKKRGS